MGEVKTGLWIYGVCQALVLLVTFIVNDQEINHDAGTGIGLFNLIAGVVVLLLSVIVFIMQKRELGRAVLLAAGLLLLTGIVACSIFPLKLN